MKIGIVERDLQGLFSDFDPFGFLDRGQLPNHICLVAVKKKENDGDNAKTEDEPLGLMLLFVTGKSVVVEWLFVPEEFSKQGVGKALLSYAYRLAKEKGSEFLFAYVNRINHREEICPGEMDYLKEYGFFEIQDLPGEWHMSLLDLQKQTIIQEKSTKKMELKAIRDLEPALRKRIMDRLPEVPACDLLFGNDDTHAWVDPHISVVCFEKKKPVGVLTGCYIQGTIYVTGIFASNEEILKAVFHSFTEKAAERFGEEQTVAVVKYMDAYEDELWKIFQNGWTPSLLYASRVDAYFDNIKASRDMLDEVAPVSFSAAS